MTHSTPPDSLPNAPNSPLGFSERDGVVYFNGVPVEQVDDSQSPAERQAHYRELIDRYTNKYRVYCASCGGTSALEKMAICRTCGDAFCAGCARGRKVYRNPQRGTGFLCPTCRAEGRFGLVG